MQTHAQEVVERYYAALDAHCNDWQDLVTDDVAFEGPVQHARGQAAFVADDTVTSMFEFVIQPPNGQPREFVHAFGMAD
jgi:hypothetical protein